jgi:hypothetical protein
VHSFHYWIYFLPDFPVKKISLLFLFNGFYLVKHKHYRRFLFFGKTQALSGASFSLVKHKHYLALPFHW